VLLSESLEVSIVFERQKLDLLVAIEFGVVKVEVPDHMEVFHQLNASSRAILSPNENTSLRVFKVLRLSALHNFPSFMRFCSLLESFGER